jgi:hypothetical protein
MRIISDFHDYYDVVQATGQDQTLIYHRKREEVSVSIYPLPVLKLPPWRNWQDNRETQIRQHIVGFCGKIYPVVVLTQADSRKPVICHNMDEVDSFVRDFCHKRQIAEYHAETKPPWRRRGWVSYRFSRSTFEKHFMECAEKRDAFSGLFIEKRCPVWIGTVLEYSWRRCAGKIVYNGSLKELEFYRLVDTYTAFQEIAMFLGGLAVPLKEIPTVPDKVMVGIKGFDQWSFRKPPAER